MPQLDHVIILVSSLSDVEAYRYAGFQVISGGKHADGLTENVLVVLPDGVYLELIAFCETTTKEQREAHWWGDKSPGLIDWSIAESGGKTLREEIEGNLAYATPQEGGRLNPEGQAIQWEVVFPVKGVRGRLPFYCSDKTPREWRVPTSKSSHENGVAGVRQLVLVTTSSRMSDYVADLSLILGKSHQGSSTDGQTQTFSITSPRGGEVSIVLKTPTHEREQEWLDRNGEGLYSIELESASGGNIPLLKLNA
jgi:hypothetical protein